MYREDCGKNQTIVNVKPVVFSPLLFVYLARTYRTHVNHANEEKNLGIDEEEEGIAILFLSVPQKKKERKKSSIFISYSANMKRGVVSSVGSRQQAHTVLLFFFKFFKIIF